MKYTRSIIILLLVLVGVTVQAQEKAVQKVNNTELIKTYKDAMKLEVESVNKKLESGEITVEESKELKSKIAKRYAQKLQDSLIKSNSEKQLDSLKVNRRLTIVLNTNGKEGQKPNKKYDVRTYRGMFFCVGFNNLKGSEASSEFKPGGSRSTEIGYNWNTRVFKDTNWLRFRYGRSVQYRNLKPKNNKYFVADNDITSLETYPESLKKSKLRITTLQVPIYFEFGPSKKIVKDNYFRYSTVDKMKFGVGGYAGIRLNSVQKLKYKGEDGSERVKEKGDYNLTDYVYGVSSYVSYEGIGVFVNYDLNPLFGKPNAKQNYFTVGLRFDLD